MEHAKNGEYHAAMEEMLRKRILRLKADIVEFKEPVDPADQD